MPLIPNVVPLGTDVVPSEAQIKEQSSAEGGERDSGYEDFGEIDDEFVGSDMEGSIMNRFQPKRYQKPPAVPQRSDKRMSKVLESVMVELKTLDGITLQKESEQETEISDPHERYLSSEEDASLSDDYEDSESLVEFGPSSSGDTDAPRTPSLRGSSRKSQKDTARLVSFTVVGKPQIIDIFFNCSSSQKRHSVSFDIASDVPSLPKGRRPAPLKLYPSSLRRLSVASTLTASTHTSNTPSQALSHESTVSLTSLPPRKSSKLASNFSSLVNSTKHAFLSSDPFPANEAKENLPPNRQSGQESAPEPPKTPISIAAAVWRTGLSRTLSKARKPSMPKISIAYTAGVVQSRNASKPNLSGSGEEEFPTEEMDPWKQRQRAATTPQTPHEGPVRYEDIMRTAIKAPPPPPYSPVKERKLSLGMRGLTRRKSVRGRSDRYLG
jgi:hypothetical protein